MYVHVYTPIREVFLYRVSVTVERDLLYNVHVLMRDEKERGKKQARSNK